MSPRRGPHPSGTKPRPTPAHAGEDAAPVASRKRRADRVRIPGDVVRAVRTSLGYTRDELREPLRVGSASLARYELGDAPPWMQYALIGVGVLERGVPVDEMVRRIAAESAAVADRARARGAGTADAGEENR